MIGEAPFHEAVMRMVPGAAEGLALTPLRGGGNNRLHRVETPAGAFVLKAYFRHPDDPRDRAWAEFAFSRFAWEAGLRTLPQPVAVDREAGLGLYAFVPGRRLEAAEVGQAEVQAAFTFLRDLQAHRDAAGNLAPASAAHFSIAGHVGALDDRLARFAEMPEGDLLDREARAFVDRDLRPVWARLRERILRHPDAEAELPREARVISPSDFGFHNALRKEDGSLVFLDFEYAGWDDPAKTTGDFSSQVALPVPPEAFDAFAGNLAALLPDPEKGLRRMRLLLPLFRLTWVGIVLNPFLPVDQGRRAFAGADAASEAHREAQLGKARALLQALQEEAP